MNPSYVNNSLEEGPNSYNPSREMPDEPPRLNPGLLIYTGGRSFGEMTVPHRYVPPLPLNLSNSFENPNSPLYTPRPCDPNVEMNRFLCRDQEVAMDCYEIPPCPASIFASSPIPYISSNLLQNNSNSPMDAAFRNDIFQFQHLNYAPNVGSPFCDESMQVDGTVCGLGLAGNITSFVQQPMLRWNNTDVQNLTQAATQFYEERPGFGQNQNNLPSMFEQISQPTYGTTFGQPIQSACTQTSQTYFGDNQSSSSKAVSFRMTNLPPWPYVLGSVDERQNMCDTKIVQAAITEKIRDSSVDDKLRVQPRRSRRDIRKSSARLHRMFRASPLRLACLRQVVYIPERYYNKQSDTTEPIDPESITCEPIPSVLQRFVVASQDMTTEPLPPELATGLPTSTVINQALVSLSKPGYYMYPSPGLLDNFMTPNGECIISGLSIGHIVYGNVYFYGPLNVAGLNLDDIVFFKDRDVVIYPDEKTRPPPGVGLNVPAQITLHNIYPNIRGTNEYVTDPDEIWRIDFEARLRAVTEEYDAEFVDYQPESGSWVFIIKHLPRYGDSPEE